MPLRFFAQSSSASKDSPKIRKRFGKDFIDGKISLSAILVKCGLCSSNGDAKRSIKEGGISVNDEKVTMLRMMVSERMTQLFGENVSIHDFRVVEGPTHTNVIFDIVVPFGFEHSDTKVSEMVKHNISEIEEIDYRAVIKVEHAYI